MMGLLGTAAIAIWIDLPPEVAGDHDAWHSYEHFPERMGIPGFLRGRRGVATAGGVARYFVLYEVEHVAITVSPPYIERLNHPTRWTREIMASVRSMSRTLCRVTATHGRGVGTEILTLRFAPSPDGAGTLREWLGRDALPALARHPGIVGVHLLERDTATIRPDTDEQRLRGRPDETADWMVMLEGYDAASIADGTGRLLGADELTRRGAAPGAVPAPYRLAHVITPDRSADQR